MQDAYTGQLQAIAKLVGDKVIIQGMQVVAGVVADGWFTYGGKLVRFNQSALLDRVVINEQSSGLLYQDGQVKDVVLNTSATCGNVGGFPFSELVRLDELKVLASRAVPVGAIIMWAGVEPPFGWALCNGENGTPNLSSRFIVGYDPANNDYDAIGKVGGESHVLLSTNQIPHHSHVMNFGRTKRGEGNAPNHAIAAPDGNLFGSGFSISTQSTGGSDAHENRPPYYVLAYIIKI
ncbi:MAG TPA: hypothetical protein PKD90_04445 [Phnomibacter sp.]|nr:hypothetical protein [Phnomibacter sp.]